jgi:hypothetical protein
MSGAAAALKIVQSVWTRHQPSTLRKVVPDLVFELLSLLRANPKAMGLSDAASIMAEKATLSWII